MGDPYLWVKAGHVIAMIAWMAGLFYLPRLFVYHVERGGEDPKLGAVFETMEEKLLRVIMNPAMIATWILGLVMIAMLGRAGLSEGWLHVKLLAVVLMTVFHMWLAKRRKVFLAGENTLSGRTYRLMNEVPTVLLVVIVVMVIIKPF